MREKRQYVRMDTVFPVEFEVIGPGGGKASRGLLQGFTRDVSEGGMCIELKSFGKETEKLLHDSRAVLRLTINPPFTKHPIHASGSIAWLEKQEELLPVRYLIGVSYAEIDKKARERIIRYARRLRWIPRLTAAAGTVMLVGILGLFAHDQKLILENRRLVNQLVETAQRKSDVSADLETLGKRETGLERQLAAARERIQGLESSIASLSAENQAQRDLYEKDLELNLSRQRNLEAALKKVHEGREKLETRYKNLQEEERPAASAGLRRMYEWLKSHRNLRTGLVASFEGDASLEDWAFTYDQSLACQTFLLFRDFGDAEAILDFYASRAESQNGAFSNAYDTTDGRVVESVIHVGPNVWLGLAAIQYEWRFKDGKFLGLARQIGDWLLAEQDAEGGLKGGPSVTWYSTEHNLDAYAFFRMLFQVTGDAKYRLAQERELGWIKKYAYSVKERRVNRGKGDATIATDTFSWSVAALGPQILKQMDLDAEEIMTFAEKNCEVEVDYRLPSGKAVKVHGFDFAKAEHLGRGGVVSTEWTAQVIVTYQILADYFSKTGEKEKADRYLGKSYFYLNELQKLIITSPSRTGQGRGCLPYASTDDVDTGHGWRTPKGSRTGSVAGTAYGIFAWAGYNPFDLEHKKEVS